MIANIHFNLKASQITEQTAIIPICISIPRDREKDVMNCKQEYNVVTRFYSCIIFVSAWQITTEFFNLIPINFFSHVSVWFAHFYIHNTHTYEQMNIYKCDLCCVSVTLLFKIAIASKKKKIRKSASCLSHFHRFTCT